MEIFIYLWALKIIMIVLRIFLIATNSTKDRNLRFITINKKQYPYKGHGIIIIKQIKTCYLLIMNECIFTTERESLLFALDEISCQRLPIIQIKTFSYLLFESNRTNLGHTSKLISDFIRIFLS